MEVQRVSGYDNSPDCGGPDPSWHEGAVIVVVIVLVIVTIAAAIWALRQLLLAWGFAW